MIYVSKQVIRDHRVKDTNIRIQNLKSSKDFKKKYHFLKKFTSIKM